MGIIKVVALVLAAIIVIGVVGSAVYIGAKTIGYISNQHLSFSDAISWSANDWLDFTGLSKISDENFVKEFGATNTYIEVKACTSL